MEEESNLYYRGGNLSVKEGSVSIDVVFLYREESNLYNNRGGNLSVKEGSVPL